MELDETLGQLLVAEGFSSIDEIKDTNPETLVKIEGIEDETAKALIERAKEFYQKDQEEISSKIKDLGLENELINHKGLTPGMLVTLGEQKILKLSDFADLASDELTGGEQFEVVTKRIIVNDDGVITEGKVKQVYTKDNLKIMGLTADTFSKIDTSDLWLSNTQLITVWPSDPDLKLVGEDIYFGENPMETLKPISENEIPDYYKIN